MHTTSSDNTRFKMKRRQKDGKFIIIPAILTE
jgi:hypothetical protein